MQPCCVKKLLLIESKKKSTFDSLKWFKVSHIYALFCLAFPLKGISRDEGEEVAFEHSPIRAGSPEQLHRLYAEVR